MANQPMTDLFSQTRIIIQGNPLLEGIANHILELVQRNPELLKGDKVGVIDRKLLLAIWFDEGLNQILNSEQWEAFKAWAMNPKTCPDPEAISRARRYLAERDYIRLPKQAIEDAERQRQRISRSVRR